MDEILLEKVNSLENSDPKIKEIILEAEKRLKEKKVTSDKIYQIHEKNPDDFPPARSLLEEL